MMTQMKKYHSELLKLPEVVHKDKQAKRPVGNPDTENLKEQQLEIFKQLVEFINDPDEQMFLLEGYAGTGKTYLISMFVEWYLSNKDRPVAMTAPTNKAVKVLRRSAQYQHETLEYRTIHSLLGLREKITGYGRQVFVQNKKDDATIGEYDLVIVDEVSMLADDLMEGTTGSWAITGLMEYAEMFGTKLIFVGDPCQIPPVGKEDCIPFQEEKRLELGIGRMTLTEIIRQAADNPIIKVTLKVRQALGRSTVLPIRNDEYDEGYNGVFYLDSDDHEFFENLLRTHFTSENFKLDSDFIKIICWTNKAVKAFNKKVRHMIYGERPDKICLGEKLIANRPIANSEGEIIFNNNDEFEVQSFDVEDGDYKGADLRWYNTKVIAEEGLKTIRIVHEDSEEDYQLIKEHLAELAKAEKKGSWQAAQKWEDFYRLQEVFADVNYNYSITAHKSQGSTYRNVVVIEADVDKNRRIKERNRIKYTAFTRPSSRLYIAN